MSMIFLWAPAPNSRCSDTLQGKLSSSASTGDYRLKTAEPQISRCAIEETHLKINWPWIVSNHNFKQGLHESTPKDLGELNQHCVNFSEVMWRAKTRITAWKVVERRLMNAQPHAKPPITDNTWRQSIAKKCFQRIHGYMHNQNCCSKGCRMQIDEFTAICKTTNCW